MVRIGCLWIVLAAGSVAHAQERAVTYAEAMRGATANNGLVVTAGYQRVQAEAAVRAAQGVFDPLYTLSGFRTTSRDSGIDNGFPFETESSSWLLSTGVTGFASTGTGYDVSLSLARDLTETRTSGLVPDPNCDTGTTTDCGFVLEPLDVTAENYFSDLNVTLTQQLLRGVRYRYNLQNVTLARADLTSAELLVEKQRQDTLYAASEAYWLWAYQHQLHENAVQNVAVAEEALRVGRAQVDRGQLAPVEVTRLEAALVQAQQTELDTHNLERQAANTVMLLMGEPPDAAVTPASPPGDVPEVEIDEPKVLEVARAQNLDLAIARQALETAKIQLANAKHGILPSLEATLGAGVGNQRCAPGSDGAGQNLCVTGNAIDALTGLTADDNQPYLTIGGIFTAPLGNRVSRGDRDAAEAIVMQRQREMEDVDRQVAASVDQGVRTLQSARQRMDLADANLRLAEQTLAAEEALATVGRSIQKTVLEARAAVQAAKAEAAKSRTDYRLAQAQLLALQGQLSDEVP
jgi:outer membrane protein TolC